MRTIRLLPEVILIPFIIHRLGEEEYGIFILAWSVYPVMDRLRAGVGSSLVKYSAAYFESRRFDQVNQLLSSACVLLGAWGLFGGGVLLLSANLKPQWLASIDTGQVDNLRFALNIMAAMVMVVFPLMPFAGVLHALQRYDQFSIVNTAFAYLRISLIIGWFFTFGASLKALVVISALGLTGNCIIFVVLAFKQVPTLEVRLGHFRLKALQLMAKFGGMILLISICMLINTTGLNWLVGIVESAALVGVLAIVLKPSQLLKEIIDAMALSIMPAASRYAAMGNTKLLSELFVRSTRYITLVAAVSLGGILFLARPLLDVWMGPEYQYLAPYMSIICAAMAFSTSSAAAEHVLRGMGRLRMSVMAVFSGMVVCSLGMISLLYLVLAAPLPALACGLGIGYCVTAILRLSYVKQVLGVRWSTILWQCYGQLLLIQAPVAITCLFVMHILHVEQIPGRLLAACFCAVTTLATYYLLFFSDNEKTLALDIFTRFHARLRRLRSQN
jgi:O-antigen/teichoic acid export membrane protein